MALKHAHTARSPRTAAALTRAKFAGIAAGITGLVALGTYLYRRFGPSTVRRFHTMFGTARVYCVADDNGAEVRLLEVGGIVQSGTYTDDERCFELVFQYLKEYDRIFGYGIPIERVCVLGCGGYDYPEHLIAHFPDIRVDAVEIDPAITALARRWFFLDRLIEEYDIERTKRLRLICSDAHDHLRTCAGAYDAIINDTFDAGEPSPAMTSLDALRAVHERLVPGGLYATNIVSALEGPRSVFLHEQIALMHQVFAQIDIYPCAHGEFDTEDNVVVICRK